MKKNNLLIIGAVGIAAYFLFFRKGGANLFSRPAIDDESEGAGTEAKTDETTERTTIEAQPGRVTQALTQAKEIVQTVKNAVVTVKTPQGKKIKVGRKSRLKKDRKAKEVKATRKPSRKYRRMAKRGQVPTSAMLQKAFMPS